MMKMGRPKAGVRWHPSYEIDHVRSIVEERIKNTIGMASVAEIKIAFTPRSTTDKMET